MNNAIYVIDEEYSTFAEAWVDLQKLLPLTAPLHETVVEPLRLTFEKNRGEIWINSLTTKPDEMGWHFVGNPSDSFFTNFKRQTEILMEKLIRFRAMGESTGKAQSIDLRYDPSNAPYLAIPYEDDVRNVGRFYGRYLPAFEKAYDWSQGQAKAKLSDFHKLSIDTFPELKAMDFQVGGLFKKKPGTFRWQPILGTVGRHTILTELRFSKDPPDVVWLGQFLSDLVSVERKEPPVIYLQFFSSFKDRPQITMPEENLYEMTYTFDSAPYSTGKSFLDALHTEVRDSFTLFEQPHAQIGSSCSATYILRRATNKMYEIRVNVTWNGDGENKAIDPEEAVVSLEKQSGRPWAVIA